MVYIATKAWLCSLEIFFKKIETVICAIDDDILLSIREFVDNERTRKVKTLSLLSLVKENLEKDIEWMGCDLADKSESFVNELISPNQEAFLYDGTRYHGEIVLVCGTKQIDGQLMYEILANWRDGVWLVHRSSIIPILGITKTIKIDLHGEIIEK